MDLVANMKKGKTEVMLFGTPQKVKDKSPDIKYCFKSLSTTKSYKYIPWSSSRPVTITQSTYRLCQTVPNDESTTSADNYRSPNLVQTNATDLYILLNHYQYIYRII